MSTEALEKKMQQVGDLAVQYMQVYLKDGDKNASGYLSNNIESKVSSTNDIIDVEIDMPDYAQYVESGRKSKGKWEKGKKGFPPVKALKDWINQKPISLKGGVTTDTAAFLIGRSIFENGIKPFPFITRAIDRAIEESEETIYEALSQDVGFTIEQSFNETKTLKEKS